MNETAKIFICNHPDQLFLYKNFVKIIKRYDQDAKNILLKVDHPFFVKFNFKPYEQYFDEIVEFKFIHYKKNFLIGLAEALAFKRRLKKVASGLLKKFKTIDLFLTDSAWLPVNILLYHLSKEKQIKNIVKWTGGDGREIREVRTDKIKTIFCSLYHLLLRCFRVKVMKTFGGKLVGFVYAEKTPGISVRMTNPAGEIQGLKKEEIEILPYPILSESSADETTKKDMVIIFGDASIYQCYSEYLPEHEIFVQKLVTVFREIENKYSNDKLYYKLHPADRKQIMPGINPEKYTLFDNTMNAQMILDAYHSRIKAVYTISSTSSIAASFFGIPSYTFYRYLFNPSGIKMLDSMFCQENLKSRFLFHISDLSEIGKIDNIKCKNFYVDLDNLDARYHKVLNI